MLGLMLLLYLASGLYVMEAEQHGVVLRCGRVVDDQVAPGIHYHWPWPVERILRPRAAEVRTLEISFRHAQPHSDEGGELLTGDDNLVHAMVLLQYTLASPRITSPTPPIRIACSSVWHAGHASATSPPCRWTAR